MSDGQGGESRITGAQMGPVPSVETAARPRPAPDNGAAATTEMTDTEFYAHIRPQIAAMLDSLGVGLTARVSLRTDEDGCIRVHAEPVFVRQR